MTRYAARSGVGIGIEATFGTAATSLGYRLPFTSESLNQKIDMLKSEAKLRSRFTKAMGLGKEGAEGELSMELYPEIAGLFFYLALGNSVLDVDHAKITPIDFGDGSLPSVSIGVSHDGIPFDYLGMKVNSLKLDAALNAIAKISANFIGVQEVDGAISDDASIVVPSEPYWMREMTFSLDGFSTVADDLSSVSLSIENNLDNDDYRADGTGQRKSLEAQAFGLTGNIEAILDASTKASLLAKYKSGEDIQLAVKFEKTGGSKLIVTMPKLRLTEAPHDISDGKILVKAGFTGVKPSAGNIIEVEDYYNATGTY